MEWISYPVLHASHLFSMHPRKVSQSEAGYIFPYLKPFDSFSSLLGKEPLGPTQLWETRSAHRLSSPQFPTHPVLSLCGGLHHARSPWEVLPIAFLPHHHSSVSISNLPKGLSFKIIPSTAQSLLVPSNPTCLRN